MCYVDKNAPKRASSAFILFSNDERPKVKAENPNIAFGEVAKVISERWKSADEKTKVCNVLNYNSGVQCDNMYVYQSMWLTFYHILQLWFTCYRKNMKKKQQLINNVIKKKWINIRKVVLQHNKTMMYVDIIQIVTISSKL